MIGLAVLCLSFGCANDIALFREGQEKSYVVFGLLSTSSPDQQVKIRMTSVSNAPLSEISLDSSEFSAPEGLDVYIQEWQNCGYSLWPLQPVRYGKEPGVFLNTRNDLFETRLYPDLEKEYKLIISDPATGEQVTAKALPVPPPKLGAPNWPWIRYNFSDTVNPFNIRFREVPRAYVYLTRFTILYADVLLIGDTVYREVHWVFRPRYDDTPPDYIPTRESFGNEYNRSMTGQYTLNVFNLLIPDIEGLSHRRLICFEVSVWAGDQTLRNYTELGSRFQDNRRHYFTNLSNGIGFFAGCSHSSCTGIMPDPDFMLELTRNPATRRLGFTSELLRTDRLKSRPDARSVWQIKPEETHE